MAIAGDFNRDGRTDLAFHRPVSGAGWTMVPVLQSKGDGTWEPKRDTTNTAPAWVNDPGVVATAGDFNDDDRTDLAFHRPLSPPLPPLSQGQPDLIDSARRPIESFGFRGWTTVPVLLSSATDTWEAKNNTAPAYVNAPGVVAIAGDFDGDGRTDLAFRRPVSGAGWTTVPVLLSNATGTWDAKNNGTPPWANEPGAVSIAGD